jgi:hypothetical protein
MIRFAFTSNSFRGSHVASYMWLYPFQCGSSLDLERFFGIGVVRMHFLVRIFCANRSGSPRYITTADRARSHIISVVRQIQRFDFDCSLVVQGNIIILI